MALKTVQLTNGSEVAEPVVVGIMLQLQGLLHDHPTDFYEVTMIARDQTHDVWQPSKERLQRLALIEQDGSMHNDIRQIILCAVEGDGMDMSIVYPIM